MPGTYEPGEKPGRLIQLFQRLSETHVGLTTKQLADELEVNQRTVQRYVATLRESAGIDIDDKGGRLRIGERSRLPAMQLDRYQATMLLVALRLLHQLRTEQDPALVGALAQLSSALRIPLVTRYLESTLQHAEQRPVNPERTQLERTVLDGFVDSRAVEVVYVDGEGRESTRVLEPYFIEPAAEGRHMYVFAQDSISGEVRPFRFDRIRSARLLPMTFQVPDSFDIDSVVSSSWGVWQSETPDDIVLRFSAEAGRWVLETRWHPSAVITELPDGRREVRLRVASEQEMRPWVLRWGPNVEVLQPESLRNYVADALRRAAEQYQHGAAGDGAG